jgi:hypothetical protein
MSVQFDTFFIDLMGTYFHHRPSVQVGETKNEKNGRIDLKNNMFI